MSGDRSSALASTQVDLVQGVPVLRVIGEIDMTTSEMIRGTLLTCLDTAASTLVLDLNEVTFLASSGLALISEALGYADQRDIAFVVVAGDRSFLRLLQTTSLDELLTIYSGLDPAIAALHDMVATTSPLATGVPRTVE
ncbi:STAS domain-containing protein [Umezawaea sp. Da 62-37]|uniref:STAS domain-containing protein n=1 Tax=Umezawaea sp. Da 62-37 TaxID=3075927 RepID=UPI0028F74046|nr:STAS domain-containing protein [Umezawaea sp. Da 62-37]WNV82903.1 STAS domain-containing protein [Umezawaea sp. Da 62-37]